MDYDALTEEFIRNMHSLHAAVHKGNVPESIRGESFILIFIREGCGKAAPKDIRDATGVSTARVAAELNSLEKKGLITRRTNHDDRRRTIVELTPKGIALAEEHKKTHERKILEILTLLGEEDSAEFVRIVGRLPDIISKGSSE